MKLWHRKCDIVCLGIERHCDNTLLGFSTEHIRGQTVIHLKIVLLLESFQLHLLFYRIHILNSTKVLYKNDNIRVQICWRSLTCQICNQGNLYSGIYSTELLLPTEENPLLLYSSKFTTLKHIYFSCHIIQLM